jgi:hypothetical protein
MDPGCLMNELRSRINRQPKSGETFIGSLGTVGASWYPGHMIGVVNKSRANDERWAVIALLLTLTSILSTQW